MENTKKILIIEDQKIITDALKLKFKHENFEATDVSNGELAIDLLKKEKFALILCDLIMPKVDGFKVLEFIKNSNIETPVIVLTNLSQKEEKKRAKEFGVKKFFVKSNTSLSEIVFYIKEIIF